jgi:hypothetical protein
VRWKQLLTAYYRERQHGYHATARELSRFFRTIRLFLIRKLRTRDVVHEKSRVCRGRHMIDVQKSKEFAYFPGAPRRLRGSFHIVEINFLCKLFFNIPRVSNYHCTAGEQERTAEFESPNNCNYCKDFGTTMQTETI